MSLFTEIEKTIERSFRRWTERVFGPADSDELLLVHRAILEDIESKVQILARGKRVFPYSRVTVTLASENADRRALYQTAFGEGGRLDNDVREALDGVDCEVPRGFGVEVRTSETGAKAFEIEYGVEARPAVENEARGAARVIVVKGKAAQPEYQLEKARTNIGRIAELTDHEQRVIRRNDVVFEEGGDEANSTVSRRHAHIRLEAGDYRICDDESEFGTRVFRDGRPIEVPAGNRRGEKLRPGDEIYLGRACLRFER
ncbi:MAG TPA: FHA domain-containing protein [Bryobacteraceae bacterium]|nr:FHA domain-containing protein [Bryobacteraceae bacterium]